MTKPTPPSTIDDLISTAKTISSGKLGAGTEVELTIPTAKEDVLKLINGFLNKIVEKDHQIEHLQKEVKEAVRRKKAKKDPLAGNVALVMFTRRKQAEGKELEKVRMFVADKVQFNEALQTAKRLKTDPDNDFIGCFFLQTMRGKENATEILSMNAEAVWHLFEKLDKDLHRLSTPVEDLESEA